MSPFCAGMISGQLLQSLCPAPGACPSEAASVTNTSTSSDVAPSPPLRAGAERATSAAIQTVNVQPKLPSPCRGRPMWLIIGLITLSSPLAILLTQVCLYPWPCGLPLACAPGMRSLARVILPLLCKRCQNLSPQATRPPCGCRFLRCMCATLKSNCILSGTANSVAELMCSFAETFTGLCRDGSVRQQSRPPRPQEVASATR